MNGFPTPLNPYWRTSAHYGNEAKIARSNADEVIGSEGSSGAYIAA
jgi:hypothetical protein